MKVRKILYLSVFVAMMLTPMIAFQAAKADTASISITFWYTENDVEKPGVLALVEAFEAANTDIDVEATQVGFFDCHDQYVTAFIAGEEPDVCRSVRDWAIEWAGSGMLEPLTAEFTTADVADYLPIALDLITFPDADGVDQKWGFPQLVDTPAFVYNKEYFVQAGIDPLPTLSDSWTWEEFIGNSTLLVASSNATYATTLAGLNYGFEPYYYGHGGQYFTDNVVSVANINLDSAETRAAMEFLKDNVTEAAFTPAWEEQGWGTVNPLFMNGTAAFISQGPWELKNFLEDNSASIFTNTTTMGNYTLGIMQLPHDEDNNSGSPVGMHSFTVSAYSDEKVAAIKLAKFMSSEESQADGAIKYYHSPARQSVMDRTDVKAADTFEWVNGYYKAVADVGVTIPKSMFWGQLDGDFAGNVGEYLSGTDTLDKAINDTIAIWSTYIDTKADDIRDANRRSTAIPGYNLYLGIAAVGAIAFMATIIKRKK